jgi:spore coat protein U-like protein
MKSFNFAFWLLSALAPACCGAASCAIAVPAVLNFGVYDTVNALRPPPWIYTITCHRTAAGNVTEVVAVDATLSVGSGTYAARTMSSGVNLLNYNLYRDASYTRVRGNRTGGTGGGGRANFSLSSANPTATLTRSLYGRIPGGQSVPPGVYTTTLPIVITVNY